MEWLQGPSLGQAVRQGGSLPESEATRIAIHVANSLHQVHERGLAHRDLKPSNILLRPDGTPVLIDFGILRHLGPAERTELTQRAVGTPAYMAPETLKSPACEGALGSRRNQSCSAAGAQACDGSAPPDPDPRGSHEVVLTMAFDDLSAYFRWVDDGVVRLDERVKDVLPARDFGGVIEHLVLGVKSNEGAMADVAIQSIRAWGLKKSPAEMTYVNGPRAEVARKLTELRTDLDLEPLSPTDSERST